MKTTNTATTTEVITIRSLARFFSSPKLCPIRKAKLGLNFWNIYSILSLKCLRTTLKNSSQKTLQCDRLL